MSKTLETATKLADQLSKVRVGIKQLEEMEKILMKEALEVLAVEKEDVVTEHGKFVFSKVGSKSTVDYKKFVIDNGFKPEVLSPYTTTSVVKEHIKFSPTKSKTVKPKTKTPVKSKTLEPTSVLSEA